MTLFPTALVGGENDNKLKHVYNDHSLDMTDSRDASIVASGPRHCSDVPIDQQPFPVKLHIMLEHTERDGLAHICTWQPHGRCFIIHSQNLFQEEIMPTYFKGRKFSSFQRQLNLYAFNRITSGPDKGGYYHELFLRHKLFLCRRMTRVKVKGTGVRRASCSETEPNFYAMPPLTPQHNPASWASGISSTLITDNPTVEQAPPPPCLVSPSTSINSTATALQQLVDHVQQEPSNTEINNTLLSSQCLLSTAPPPMPQTADPTALLSLVASPQEQHEQQEQQLEEWKALLVVYTQEGPAVCNLSDNNSMDASPLLIATNAAFSEPNTHTPRSDSFDDEEEAEFDDILSTLKNMPVDLEEQDICLMDNGYMANALEQLLQC